MLGGGQRVPLLPSILSFTARWMSVPLFERSRHLCYASDDLKRLPASVCRSLRGLPATHGCTESLQLAGSLPSSFLCLAPQPCSTALPMGLAFALFFELHQQALPGTEGCTVFCCYGLRAAGIPRRSAHRAQRACPEGSGILGCPLPYIGRMVGGLAQSK